MELASLAPNCKSWVLISIRFTLRLLPLVTTDYCLNTYLYWFHGVHRRAFYPAGLGARSRVSVPRLWPSGVAMFTMCIVLYSSMGLTPRVTQNMHARRGLTRMRPSGQKLSSLGSYRLHEFSFLHTTQTSLVMSPTFQSQAMHILCWTTSKTGDWKRRSFTGPLYLSHTRWEVCLLSKLWSKRGSTSGNMAV